MHKLKGVTVIVLCVGRSDFSQCGIQLGTPGRPPLSDAGHGPGGACRDLPPKALRSQCGPCAQSPDARFLDGMLWMRPDTAGAFPFSLMSPVASKRTALSQGLSFWLLTLDYGVSTSLARFLPTAATVVLFGLGLGVSITPVR